MTITGQFRRNGREARTASFSALATRLFVWDIGA
jgi:hypothetical protein